MLYVVGLQMKSGHRRALIFFTLAAALAAQSQPDSLIGRWRSLEASAAGVSTVFEFHEDNRLDSYSAVISAEKYRLIGTDTILLQSREGREEKQELEWDNPDRARIEDEAAGKSIELTRLGKSPDSRNPLVGEWSTTQKWHGQDYPARAVFFADKHVLWIIHLRAEHGRYAAENQNIRLEISNRPVVSGKFAVAGNRLTIANPQGGQSTFERF